MIRFKAQKPAVLLMLLAFIFPPAAGAQSSPQASFSDVLVVGGTPAGVAAAIAAARGGATVSLVSAAGDLGGELTDAAMDQWDLNLAPGGGPVQHDPVFEELYARLGDAFTPASAARTFAAMVSAEPRISVRYDEVPSGVSESAVPAASPGETGEKRHVDAVAFRNVRDGSLLMLRARYVIDATDDGDVAVLAGARYDVGRQDSGLDERMQAVTQMFAFDGIDWPLLAATYDVRRYGYGGVVGPRAWGYSKVMRDYRSANANVLVRDLNLGRMPDGSVSVNAVDVCGIDGRDPAQLEIARRETEVEAGRLADYLRERVPGFARARVGWFAPAVYVRETRHIVGVERLTTADVWNGRIPADSIGLASYPIDLHPVDPTDEPAYAPVRHVYGIPFGALEPAGLANVLLAGPAISASHLASGSARVVPTTIEEGEADGNAFASMLTGRGWLGLRSL